MRTINQWVYQASGGTTGEVTRKVVSGPDVNGRFILSETEDGTPEPADYRVTAAGIEAFDPLGAREVWPGIHAALPSLLEYPTPLYPASGVREIVRQGDIGVDLDGDGRNDYFRVQIVKATESTYYAPGLGLVRADREAQDSDLVDIVSAYTIELVGAKVNGVNFGSLGALGSRVPTPAARR